MEICIQTTQAVTSYDDPIVEAVLNLPSGAQVTLATEYPAWHEAADPGSEVVQRLLARANKVLAELRQVVGS